MRDAFVLVFAAGVAGAVVWRLTAGEFGLPRLIRRRPRFDDTFEVAATPAVLARAPADGLSFDDRGTAEPAHRVWSLFRLVVMIAVVSAAGAAIIWTIGQLVNVAIAQRLAP